MKRAILLALALALSGCASTAIKNLDALEPIPLEPNEIMPTKAELAGQPLRVVVFEADDGDIALAKSARVGGTIAREIEKYLNATGVELVDRSIAVKLQEELMLAEMQGQSDYAGPEVADFAIVGAISQTAAGSSFTESRRWQDKQGKWHRIPAKCSYNAEVAGTVRIYRMPSMQPVETLNLDGRSSSSEETRTSGCPIYRESAEGMARAAATHGIRRISAALQNHFAPRGYVMERRSGNGKHIIKVTLGRKQRLEQGNVVKIMNLTRTINPLTHEESIESYELGTGRVSDQIGNDFAWVIVNSDIVGKIRLGQPVQIKYRRGFFD